MLNIMNDEDDVKPGMSGSDDDMNGDEMPAEGGEEAEEESDEDEE